MDSNLADIIFNQLIGAVIGTLVSFAMSWYFYKKADFPTRVAGDMTENILAMIIHDRMGGNFDFHEVSSKDQLPKDKDTPHIIQFWYSTKTPKQGESVWFYFASKTMA